MLQKSLHLLKILAISAAAVAAGPANASIMVAGYTFDDDAFADSASGTGFFNTSTGDLVADLTDVDVNTYALSGTVGWNVELSFLDNVAFNGSGVDIVLFELGEVLDGWKVTINGITLDYAPSVFTGFFGTVYQINSVGLDLSDFGVAAGQTVSSLRLSEPANPIGSVSTSLVGALNSRSVGTVPEPAAWTMMITGFGFVGAALRRRREAQAALASA